MRSVIFYPFLLSHDLLQLSERLGYGGVHVMQVTSRQVMLLAQKPFVEH